MADLTILYWRDIPSQVIARAGRKTAKAMLPNQFMDAVDAAAMRVGATGTDEYLAGWRRGEPTPCKDDLEAAVAEALAEIERTYDAPRLKQLIKNGGREPTRD